MAPGLIEDASDTSKRPTALKPQSDSPRGTVQERIDAAISRFEKRNPVSKRLHNEAILSLPGGNTRTLLHTSPYPVCMKSGRGHQVTDEDDHT